MMYSEFFERTKVEIDADEYHYVEESYYEFEGNKDEFCKAWLKDRKSGTWAKELRLRKALDAQKAQYEAQLAEKEEDLEWYREQYRLLSNRGVCVTIKCKNENPRTFDNVTVKYIGIDNGVIQPFYRVDEKSGWTTCYRVSDIESIEFKVK